VRVDAGEVTLDGTVPDRRTKRLAEAVVDQVRGVVDVHNRLKLAGQRDAGGKGGEGGGSR
jgi:osmotically-inducible protein OsmY